ncbi:MAG: hypothetical protein K2P80_03905 [Beijerinckiaceae bacterium]|nr:hypothetical protein [Beijerinckiaceae bacterium]
MAISLLSDTNADGHPYYRSQRLAVAAQEEGRSDDAQVYWRASRKIASVLGYRPGPKAYEESRSVKPTMKIDGRRIVRTTPWWNLWD